MGGGWTRRGASVSTGRLFNPGPPVETGRGARFHGPSTNQSALPGSQAGEPLPGAKAFVWRNGTRRTVVSEDEWPGAHMLTLGLSRANSQPICQRPLDNLAGMSGYIHILIISRLQMTIFVDKQMGPYPPLPLSAASNCVMFVPSVAEWI